MNPSNSFKEKYRNELKQITIEYRYQLNNEIIPFWESRVLDETWGGYHTFFTREGLPYDYRKPGWFVGRTMYMFSSLYHHWEPRESFLEVAKAGRKFLDGPFYAGDGRFNRMLSQEGEVLEGCTSVFTDHFAVKGLYKYIVACGKERKTEDVELAARLTHALFEHTNNPDVIAQVSPVGMQTHALNFMNLQVAQNSREVLGETYQPLIDECVRKTLYQFVDDSRRANLENLSLDGKPLYEREGRVLDPGHTVEALWFCLNEGMVSKNENYIRRAGQLLDWVIDGAYDEENGGFYHRYDVDGGAPEKEFEVVDYGPVEVAWNDKVWWVQCEALLALCMSAILNENERHYDYFLKQMDYTETHFRDRQYGEWYSILKPDGSILCDLKGFAGKGPYHVPRCLLQLVKFIENYLDER